MYRLFHLGSRELGMLVEAFLALTVSRAALWCLPYRTIRRWAETERARGAASRERAELVGRAIARAARRTPWRSTCLVQALAAQWMLARRRSEARLRFGVARADGSEIEAHAWVESAGVLVTGGPSSHVARYAVLGPSVRTEL
jgi:hypothetical protein